jgi:hypothetical protein
LSKERMETSNVVSLNMQKWRDEANFIKCAGHNLIKVLGTYLAPNSINLAELGT